MAITFKGPRQKLVNDWNSNLNGAIGSGDSTITVDDATGLPTDGKFRVKIGSELIECSGRTANAIAVLSRGIEGTTAEGHADGNRCECVLTASGLQRYLLENRATGYSEETLPSDGSPIPLNRSVDETGMIVTAADFTWVNQGLATITDSNGGFILKVPSVNGNNQRIVLLTAPSNPFRVVAKMRFGPGIQNGRAYMGLAFKASGNRLLTSLVQQNGFAVMGSWFDATTYNADVDSFTYWSGESFWVRMTDDGTNIFMQLSNDGNNWTVNSGTWWKQGRTAWLTTGPAFVGFYANSSDSGSNPSDADTSFIIESFFVEKLP